MTWQEFEDKCVVYLAEKYGVEGRVVFDHKGKTDSTLSDIEVRIAGEPKFFIEIKMGASQCGQFVLASDEKTKNFIFSPGNHSAETATTKKIISYMNARFDQLKDGGELDLDRSISYDWVIEHYQNLGAKYVITARADDFIIFPLEKIANYFDIEAVYRPKQSGSRSPSKAQQEQILARLGQTIPNFSYRYLDGDLIVNGDGLKKGSRFDLDDAVCYLAEHPAGYRVRTLSKTRNLNVIFSIFLKDSVAQDPADLAKFVSDLGL